MRGRSELALHLSYFECYLCHVITNVHQEEGGFPDLMPGNVADIFLVSSSTFSCTKIREIVSSRASARAVVAL